MRRAEKKREQRWSNPKNLSKELLERVPEAEILRFCKMADGLNVDYLALELAYQHNMGEWCERAITPGKALLWAGKTINRERKKRRAT